MGNMIDAPVPQVEDADTALNDEQNREADQDFAALQDELQAENPDPGQPSSSDPSESLAEILSEIETGDPESDDDDDEDLNEV